MVSKKSVKMLNKARVGSKNGMWKEDNVGYSALHLWVKAHKLKSNCCKKCGKKTSKLELANLSGKYKRNVKDYKWLCVKCHRLKDGNMVKPTHKKIKQLSMKGKLIKKWDSIKEASKFLKINSGNIGTVAHNLRNHAGGFKWQFVNYPSLKGWGFNNKGVKKSKRN